MEIPCIVERVIFRKDKFALLACNLDPYSDKITNEIKEKVRPYIDEKWDTFTVVIDVLDEDEKPEGQSYIFVGDLVVDPKRGKQFKASGFYQDVPTNYQGMKNFLMLLPNIKKSRSEEILSKFKVEEIPEILDNEPDRFLEVRGITKKRLDVIKKDWIDRRHKKKLYEWFINCGIPVKLADKAYQIWRQDTQSKLLDNPYLLTNLKGIGFLAADNIAHKINKDVNDKSRVNACMKYCLEEDSRQNGNLCTPYTILKNSILQTLKKCDESLGKDFKQTYAKIIPLLVKDPLSEFTAVKDKIENLSFVYLNHVWEREKFIAEILYQRSSEGNFFECDDEDIDLSEKNLSFFIGKTIKLDKTQKEAIKSAFNNRVSIITGGGGTGKSTICRCIYSIAREKKMTVNMMSPTGKAAKVLTEKTGGSATTIHRGLKIGPDDLFPSEFVTQDILLVDEISMAGVDTMYALMVAIENNPRANIVFVGDKNQLPSVSPGNFLTDLINSGCANVVTLDKIHRQDENSYISIIADDISKGVVTMIPDEATDITWIDLCDATIDRDIVKFIDVYLKKGDIDDIQFISPMKKGMCGVHRLNEIVQKKMSVINKTKDRFIEKEFQKFHVGDRVIQTKNNYEKNVFNGDMGVILDVGTKISDPKATDKKEKFIEVDFGEEIKTYFGKDIEELMVAWVITVHKFQGSQSKNIVVFLASEASIMMSKELVYTGFTRAEKHLYVYGQQRVYRLAPSRSSIKRRFTNLNNIIKELSSKKSILQVV